MLEEGSNHIPRAVRPIGNFLSLLAVFVLIGGHWAVLQTAAWTGMLFNYSRSYGVTEGMAKTFDGAHPCKLCLKVKDGQKKEDQKTPLFKTDKKADVFLLSACEQIQVPFSSPFSHSILWKLTYSTRSDPLPSPVPRTTVA